MTGAIAYYDSIESHLNYKWDNGFLMINIKCKERGMFALAYREIEK